MGKRKTDCPCARRQCNGTALCNEGCEKMHMHVGGRAQVAQAILFLAFPVFSELDFATYMFPHHNFLLQYAA